MILRILHDEVDAVFKKATKKHNMEDKRVTTFVSVHTSQILEMGLIFEMYFYFADK